MSIFDPDSFLNDTTTEVNDTTIQPVPPGEYIAQIEKVESREVNGREGPRYTLEITYDILDDGVKLALGRDKVTARQTIWLDLNSNNKIDTGKGKNVGLGKLRAATGLNEAGNPFAASMFVGRMVKVITGLRADKNDPSIQYTDVKSVGRAA